jgi:hypothetical protein
MTFLFVIGDSYHQLNSIQLMVKDKILCLPTFTEESLLSDEFERIWKQAVVA